MSPCHRGLLINNSTRYILSVIKSQVFETVGCTTKDEKTVGKQSRSRSDVFGDSRHDIGPADAGSQTVHIYKLKQTMLWLNKFTQLHELVYSSMSLHAVT